MTPKFQGTSLAALSPTFQSPRLAVGGNPRGTDHLPDTSVAPPTSPPNAPHPSSHTHAADYVHDATQITSVTIRTKPTFQRLIEDCKKAMRGLSKRQSQYDAATLSTVSRNMMINKSCANWRTIQSDAFRSDTLQDQITMGDTWNVLIHICYGLSQNGSHISHFAMGRFDSQCPVNLMSSNYAATILGLHFKDAVPECILEGLTGEPYYSIGVVHATFAPNQDVPLCSDSGERIVLPAKTYPATFHVIQSDRFDVYIGHPSLVRNGLYGMKHPQAGPFRGPTAPSSSAQDQDYLRRMEAERLAVAQIAQQQVSSKGDCEPTEKLIDVESSHFAEVRSCAAAHTRFDVSVQCANDQYIFMTVDQPTHAFT